jgi:hypothetical protein
MGASLVGRVWLSADGCGNAMAGCAEEQDEDGEQPEGGEAQVTEEGARALCEEGVTAGGREGHARYDEMRCDAM